jgi:lipopolysaccharide transport system ATP-binding protein
VFHITHAKAGSQWLRQILHDCAPDRIVTPQYEMAQFFREPVCAGMIYPALYVTREEFDSIALPTNSRSFVVIRDLRDTLVSWYFSVKVSHVADHPRVLELREVLNARDQQEGLIWSLESRYFHEFVAIQRSWQKSGKQLIRYEDLLERDEEVLERVLLHECCMPIKDARLREVVQANRFERVTGRARGTEDISSHWRKGIVGDWRNYFTDPVKDLFKERFGGVLIETGYESANDW